MLRQQALEIVRNHVKNEALVKHMLCVEAVMRSYAENLGEDVPVKPSDPLAALATAITNLSPAERERLADLLAGSQVQDE